ncbi:metal-dependent hydrolase family protein [Ilumatobacter coccineus]|uniref:Putative hydrolase n=1 Tax=Ilumatobacter coccineus (strain NBRC 103263 / KCTC 29153 / YM16-304) TaxID=1313172 RepID=A0A6C7EH55_ILUCY|nr:amidohydrolase family protein [Ilumatobacter coccineus]BAN03908.1 putative hydrolase [Ilumatobacter coccineus YM16-304]
MSGTLITNARLFVGVDETVIADGAVLIEGDRIVWSGPTADAPDDPDVDGDVERVDVAGRFVMPGMTESHVHLSYSNAHPSQLDKQPVPIAMLDAVDNAAELLRMGFTSAISFGSAQGIDVHLRDAIDSGRVAGPRLLASDRDIGSTGSNADNKEPASEGRKRIADGPWAVRAAVREVAKSGADVVKIFLDGEELSAHAAPGVISYTDEEVEAACTEAHARGLRVACHARSAEAVKQAVRFGVDFIGHANFLDDEAVEMLAAARDRIIVGPGIAWEIQLLNRGHEIGLSRAAMVARGYQREVDETVSAVKRLREVRVPLTIGGDYGLSITPHGTNATDLQYFVELFEMGHAEALLCATRDGGKGFDPAGMVGTLEAETFADLVVVDGDPTGDVTVLQDPDRIVGVMKAGAWHHRHL